MVLLIFRILEQTPQIFQVVMQHNATMVILTIPLAGLLPCILASLATLKLNHLKGGKLLPCQSHNVGFVLACIFITGIGL